MLESLIQEPEKKESKFPELYDYKADIRSVLIALNYGLPILQTVQRQYQLIVDASSTAFNFYRFGRFFQILRSGLNVQVSTGQMTQSQASIYAKKVQALESYILPRMCISGELDF